MQCFKLLNCIHDAKKCPSQFHPCSSKCHETLVRLKIQPSPSQKLPIVEGLILAIVVLQHLLKRASVPPQLVCFHGFYMDGIKLYDTWMISGTSQCLHKKSTPCLVFILHFYLFDNKLNVQKHSIKVFNAHFANFAMSTLPTWTIQSRHNGGRSWSLSLCLVQVCLLPLFDP
jgi:hypothetical protein